MKNFDVGYNVGVEGYRGIPAASMQGRLYVSLLYIPYLLRCRWTALRWVSQTDRYFTRRGEGLTYESLSMRYQCASPKVTNEPESSLSHPRHSQRWDSMATG